MSIESYDKDCPVCHSQDVVEISDDEKNHALGLWNIYDQIGRINILTLQYHCQSCGHEW